MFRSFVLCLLTFCLGSSVFGAVVPARNLEQLSRESHLIARGVVTHQWSAWDNGYRFIWTHYEIKTSEMWKGVGAASFIISEPGGTVGGAGMAAEGVPRFLPNEQVVVFAKQVLPGLWRTSGLALGKLAVEESAAGPIIKSDLADLDTAAPDGSIARAAAIIPDGTPLSTLRNKVARAVGGGK